MHVKLGTYNFNKTLKTQLQAAENKCIRFCLKLGVRTVIKINVFEKKNFILTHGNQCTLSSSLWNNLDKSLETSVLLNVFKHNLNNYYFRQGIKMIGINNP